MAQIYVAGEQIGIDIYQDDLEDCFSKYGRLNNIWVARQPPGFAFITFDDSRDADDAVDGEDGRYLRDSRLRVERSRNKGGGKGKGGGGGYGDRGARSGAPQRTDHRVRVTGLSRGANWRDIKDFLREGGAVTYADVGRDGEGVAEFATRDDMEDAIYKLDGTKFRGERVKIEKESREYDFRRDGRTGREGADDRGGGYGGGDRYGDRRGGRDASRSRSRDRGRDRGGDRDRRRDDDDRGERGRRRDDDDDRGRDRDRDRDRRRGDDDDRDRRRDESPPRKDEDAKKSPARSASRSRSPARRDDDGDRSPRSDRD